MKSYNNKSNKLSHGTIVPRSIDAKKKSKGK